MNFKSTYITKATPIEPLVVFRIGFGVLMLISIIRFWYNGWIEKLYIEPSFFFSYYGFEWVKPLGEHTYWLFIICGVTSVMITLGLQYRLAIITFFLSFTYIELMDKTTYLNHYYFISILSFILIFLPLNKAFSIDSYFSKKTYKKIPVWTINSIKLLISIVYFYAGIAKVNSDWLGKAMPLKIWLPSKYDLPLIGDSLMQQEWFHYAMSWSGMLYDIAIPFLLLYRKTRVLGFAFVVIFHVFTHVLFPIGMFPYIMIVSALIFFSPGFHKKIISFLRSVFKSNTNRFTIGEYYRIRRGRLTLGIVGCFFVLQLLMPFRYIAYPGELFWTEEGYRFSWRVMLMEKMGYANFKIVDGKTGKRFYVNNSDFLTAFQEKQMSFQPDFILEYAHYLGDHFSSQGHKNVEVYVECFVALNGRLSVPYIDPEVDLYKEKESFKPKTWILPFKDEIKGL
ncbi:MAG: HTTM domain-containing protein [Flavobacteriaceae bacterium]|nr:HTTM domain-containing protein [Flavobacteriaceae bacterium]